MTVRLPSGEQRLILERCMATVGTLSNAQHKNRKIGRAGSMRWVGRKPTVRGVAMNPVDHPHGGGRCLLLLCYCLDSPSRDGHATKVG